MKGNKQFILSEICSNAWEIYYPCNMVDQLLINKVKIRKQTLKANSSLLQKKLIQVIVLSL